MPAKQLLWIHRCLSAACATSLPGFRTICREPGAGLKELVNTVFDAVILEFPVIGWTPQELLQQVLRLAPETPALVLNPRMTSWDAAHLARMGAYPIVRPNDELPSLLQQALDAKASDAMEGSSVSRNSQPEPWEALLVGSSAAMRGVRRIIETVALRRSTVLITGETGTGKELAARALHLAGPRRRNPIVPVNCSAIPDALLESEFFGHVRGAFTGAVQSRPGRFEEAHGGTLFLDEIGDLHIDLQAKLLRVLQEREFQRLGSSETIRVDVRVVAATNCDLEQKVEQGKFREDLYYRLNVVPVHLPPLRDRLEDIPLLAEHFVDKICHAEALPLKILTPEALDRLSASSWPGNVRQLENAIERSIAMSAERRVLSAADFPVASPLMHHPVSRESECGTKTLISVPDSGLDYEQTMANIERNIIAQALEKTGGNKKAAAEMLRLKRTTLSAKVRTFEAIEACG
jgi:DNA-binding NtrC family response regulator